MQTTHTFQDDMTKANSLAEKPNREGVRDLRKLLRKYTTMAAFADTSDMLVCIRACLKYAIGEGKK